MDKNNKEIKNSFFAHPTAIIDEGCVIGNGSKIWHFSHIMSGCKIGEDCNIGQNVVISPDVVLGNNCKVQNNVSVYTGVVCEDDVFLGPSCVFTNVINPRSAIARKSEYKKTIIKQGASIGANATIVCGHTLGKYCLIGAGSVIREDVEDFACMSGNPAKKIGYVGEYGHRLIFNEKGIAIEKESNFKYFFDGNQVTKIE
ncbi:MAG: acetyltransferase [Bacteroidales bacterium]|jgi:UDP-2-acetamido-3-amino-2,3-dideoxy-glucuronate N-acetyltransferase|nr:acetyltransferase [Bacteroidales bacterium]